MALKCRKLVKFLRLNGSDDFRVRYFTPKLQKFSSATLISGGVDHQHDSDWNRVYRWPACGGGRTVCCNEANGSVMMRHCRCLTIWDLDTVAEMRTTRCHKFIQVSVFKMLLRDIGREAGGTFARQKPHMTMCQIDFCSACMGSSQTAVRLFFHEQAYTEYLYVQVISTIARGKSREYRQEG